jgi:hypothetical protein
MEARLPSSYGHLMAVFHLQMGTRPFPRLTFGDMRGWGVVFMQDAENADASKYFVSHSDGI